jgi:hypothetical protein
MNRPAFADNRYGGVCHAGVWPSALPAFPPLGIASFLLLVWGSDHRFIGPSRDRVIDDLPTSQTGSSFHLFLPITDMGKCVTPGFGRRLCLPFRPWALPLSCHWSQVTRHCFCSVSRQGLAVAARCAVILSLAKDLALHCPTVIPCFLLARIFGRTDSHCYPLPFALCLLIFFCRSLALYTRL